MDSYRLDRRRNELFQRVWRRRRVWGVGAPTALEERARGQI